MRGQVEQGAQEVAGEEFADLGALLHVLGDDAGGSVLEEIDWQ